MDGGNRVPKTIPELVKFYYEIFKPLYAHMQILNEPPLEMFFEMNAALDHLFGHWEYGIDEEKAVYAASGHLKRGCFDAFKLVVSDIRKHYNELCKIDTGVIDNGDFDGRMIKLWNEIQSQAAEARKAEGESRNVDTWHQAFYAWYEVNHKCAQFEREFYLNNNVSWAKKKQTRNNWLRRLEGFLVGVFVQIAFNANIIYTSVISFIKSLFNSP